MNKFGILDRRKSDRIIISYRVVVRGFSNSSQFGIGATLSELSKIGGKLILEKPFDNQFRPKIIDSIISGQPYSVPISEFKLDRDGNLIFESTDKVIETLYDAISELNIAQRAADRRVSARRNMKEDGVHNNRRSNSRRLTDLYSLEFAELQAGISKNVQIPFLGQGQSYDESSIKQRRGWLEKKIGKPLDALADFSEEADEYRGNIENMLGVAHVPIGIAGPLRVNGQFAKGDFYVPMATTEGVLVNSYTLGMYLLTRSGGVTVRTLGSEMSIAPIFIFASVRESQVFAQWASNNFQMIKKWADSTTNHGHLTRLEPKILGRNVVIRFVYQTGDAMGLNMICKATEKACLEMRSIIKPQRFYLRSNFESDKKVSSTNFHNVHGKSLVAEVVIPRPLLSVLRSSPEEIVAYSQAIHLSGIHGGMIGNNGQFANGLTSVFVACGQDIAHVVNSHLGVTTSDITTSGDLYISACIPNLLVGTVGGGTNLPTSRACLEILDCFGPGKVNKFAEVIAATLLAGEVSISISLVNGTYVEAHEKFGRNRPK